MKIEKIEERIKAIEAVIAELPEDYQPFGFFLRLSGPEPRTLWASPSVI
ncbi:hypothetical protein GR250_04485 [Rhizobium leguminosarum]|nr:hypothetical protein [Rhizobium leguminosarum]